MMEQGIRLAGSNWIIYLFILTKIQIAFFNLGVIILVFNVYIFTNNVILFITVIFFFG